MPRMMPPRETLRKNARFVVGTMTGTSIDGELDAAIVAIEGHGLSMRAHFVAGYSHPLGALAADLRRVATQEPLPAREFTRIAHDFGELHADAISSLCRTNGVSPDLAVLHGQTVFHAPPHTWQLLNPWPVAARLGCRVRFDLRGANVASGGQGAPITPLADFILFAQSVPTIVMNLGGFINATLVPARDGDLSAMQGFDICACNHLLDHVARTRLGVPFDKDGTCAASGTIELSVRDEISQALAQPNTGDQKLAGNMSSTRRSLGTGDEAAKLVRHTDHLAPADACHTVTDAIADAAMRVISEATIRANVPNLPVLIAGGSARHRALHAAFSRRTDAPVRTTFDVFGVPVHMREAAEMAILGALADDGIAFSLPQVTGARSHTLDSALLEPIAVYP